MASSHEANNDIVAKVEKPVNKKLRFLSLCMLDMWITANVQSA